MVLLAPLVSYTAAVALSGNGFVAAFVCGIAFRYVHRILLARRLRSGVEAEHTAGSASAALSRDFTLLEDATSLLTASMWFVVGIAGVYFLSAVTMPILVFCLLALTVLRGVPVLLALIGTDLSGRERLLAGLLGPRGTTTIVFGLLAFNGLPDGEPADTIIVSTVLCVVGSVLLHGFGSSPAIDRLTAAGNGRRRVRVRPPAGTPSG
ncbi:cation:proton antiporter [Pseudonocardia sp. ICBG162]|uniref:cation:proton antiporter domain-containing protein n=1 Tax=Pseudonocardia sp. ICBG162 TaxID=2846761 RepID=UPI0027DEEBBE|nr:cation:proton antiporter [Pseudonocardia sp. ICBG162]